jgi:hypothetical protein
MSRPPGSSGNVSGDDRQRTDEDRRNVTRGGRRESDPNPTCPSCGLVVERPHGSDADCIAALRQEIASRKVNPTTGEG